MSDIFREILSWIKKHHSFLITSHEAGDGDSIGSQLAMAFILEKIQKDVFILNKDAVPAIYDFLPGVERIQSGGLKRDLAKFEAVIVLDCGSLERTGLGFSADCACLNIDHHLNNDFFGQLNWVEPQMSSTSEMVYILANKLSIPIDLSIANNLYVGILTDTGGFKYSNTSPQCLRIAAGLIEVGVKPSFVASQVYERKSLPQLLLMGSALSNVSMSEDYKVAYLVLREEIFKKYRATLADTEGLVNYALSLASVEVALLFKEISKDFFKVSFRSKGRVNVAAIAEGFAGGGHHNAAGAKIKGDFTLIQEQISKEIYAQLINSSGK